MTVTGFIGANPDELDDLARTFTRAAQRLRDLHVHTRQQVDRSTWDGLDATSFRATWSSGAKTAFEQAAGLLEDNAETLRRNAEDQRRASAADHGGSGQVGGGGEGGWGSIQPMSPPCRISPSFWERVDTGLGNLPIIGSAIDVGKAGKGFFWDAPRAGFTYGFGSDEVSDEIVRASGKGIDGAVGIVFPLPKAVEITQGVLGVDDAIFGTDNVKVFDVTKPSYYINKVFGL